MNTKYKRQGSIESWERECWKKKEKKMKAKLNNEKNKGNYYYGE